MSRLLPLLYSSTSRRAGSDKGTVVSSHDESLDVEEEEGMQRSPEYHQETPLIKKADDSVVQHSNVIW